MDNDFIGTIETIVGGVRIDPNAIAVVGAVVMRDIPANSVIDGVLVKCICSFDECLQEERTSAL